MIQWPGSVAYNGQENIMPHESLEKQIDQWCKHYASPARNETCRMGINYLELAGGDRKGYLNRLPCIRTHYKDDVVAECGLREWHTIRGRRPRTQEEWARLWEFVKQLIDEESDLMRDAMNGDDDE